jgi:HlyD family secretion protein
VNKWAVRVVMLVLAAGAVVGCVYGYRRATRPAELSYRTVTVDRGPIVARVTATGTLSAHVTVQVGAQVSGRLTEILVDFNSSVKKGQILARLDPELYKAALGGAHANTYQAMGALAQIRATLAKDTSLAERAKALHDGGLMSQQDYENALAQVKVDAAAVDAQKGQVEQNRASEHQAEINLAYCTIYSPIDGTVISRNVDVGQTVAASLTAPVLFTIAEDLHKMQVDTNVTEGDVGKLRDGMRASFVVDAYANERFSGMILQIRNAATTVQNVVTYDAVIEVENPDLKLRPGMTANATFNYDRREDTLRVPNAALRFRPPASLAPAGSAAMAAAAPSDAAPAPPGTGGRSWGGRNGSPGGSGSAGPAGSASARPRRGPRPPTDSSTKLVWVMRGPKPEPVVVKVGLTDGSFTEVVSGEIQENDEVVLELATDDAAAGSAKGGAGQPLGGGQQPRLRL